MPEDNIMNELEELSQIVEGENDIQKGLEEIEKITSEPKKENAGEVAERKTVPIKNEKKVEKSPPKSKEEEKEKNVKKEVKQPEKMKEKKPAVIVPPNKLIKSPLKFKIASSLLLVIGFGIYGLAFYLRWNGWHLISYPPSSIIALCGTLLVLAGGEVYYKGKKR